MDLYHPDAALSHIFAHMHDSIHIIFRFNPFRSGVYTEKAGLDMKGISKYLFIPASVWPIKEKP